VIIIESL